MNVVCLCSSVPAWILLIASVSFMLDHLVMTNGHWRAHNLHARQTHSGKAADNRSQQEQQILNKMNWKTDQILKAVKQL